MEAKEQKNDVNEDGNETLQYLTFSMSDQIYGVNILNVKEIISYTSATRLPNSEEFLKGVINLRGLIFPIYDLRIKFSLNSNEHSYKQNVIIVVKTTDRTVGLLVDAVSDILNSRKSEVKPTPANSNGKIEDKYLEGLISENDKMVILLDINSLFEKKIITDGIEHDVA